MSMLSDDRLIIHIPVWINGFGDIIGVNVFERAPRMIQTESSLLLLSNSISVGNVSADVLALDEVLKHFI